ncbi:MAG: hypothetical protein KQA41_04220 [Candidatus Aenigmarchaeota archaeon]|nr:hypothetical protein [Candidatus Aenigmarchaeota archaeon]
MNKIILLIFLLVLIKTAASYGEICGSTTCGYCTKCVDKVCKSCSDIKEVKCDGCNLVNCVGTCVSGNCIISNCESIKEFSSRI